ncbi:MAG: quinate 5-dehydrogenase [Anaerolineae bacterium]
MKRVVSISLGSSTRNKKVETELLGQRIAIERIGTDGDPKKARALFLELDGQVDCFGVGGADLGFELEDRYYPFYQAQNFIKGLQSPAVDGMGVRWQIERRVAGRIEAKIGPDIRPKTVLIPVAVDRYQLASSWLEAGYQCIFGDLGFGLGLPIPLRSLKQLRVLARFLLPIFGRVPISLLYPTGEEQTRNDPKFENWYRWASAISGDFLYIKRHMPLDMAGKIIVTNTTTPDDIEFCRRRGVKYLITVTPCLDGRSFGTNVMEAVIVALSGKGRPLTPPEMAEMMGQVQMEPEIQRLN